VGGLSPIFDEILPVLNKWNFKVIDSMFWNLRRQVKIFSETKYLVAVHGAGETKYHVLATQHLPFTGIESA